MVSPQNKLGSVFIENSKNIYEHLKQKLIEFICGNGLTIYVCKTIRKHRGSLKIIIS